MRAVLRALFKPGRFKTSSKSVKGGSSLGEVILCSQILNKCDSSGIQFHVNLLDDCYMVTKTFFFFLNRGALFVKIKYKGNV